MIGIYSITNEITGEVYIGQSNDIHKRWKTHKSSAYNINTEPTLLVLSMRRYSMKAFKFEILERYNESSNIEVKDWLNEKEIMYVKKYDSFINGLNLTNGGKTTFAESLIGFISGRRITTTERLRIESVMSWRGVAAEHKPPLIGSHYLTQYLEELNLDSTKIYTLEQILARKKLQDLF